MKRVTIILAFLTILSACSVTVPVVGKIGDEDAAGSTTATTSGGSFEVATIDGLVCSGTYDAWDTSPTIRIPVSCSDGRTGSLLATRTLSGASGKVIGKLNDGTRGRFVFGNLSFSQTFLD